MRKREILVSWLALALLLSGCNADTAKESGTQSVGQTKTEVSSEPLTEGEEEDAKEDEEFTGIGACQVGDTIFFGSYEQDNDKKNGAEAIEWIVLDTAGDQALLLSKYGLDAQPYGAGEEVVTWEHCFLRQWLNDTFYQTAFSKSQQNVIVPVTNTNPDNELWETPGGNDTEDKIFLLSIPEAQNYFADRNEMLWTQATPYAVEQGAYVEDNGDSPWWLRSPGNNNEGGFCAAYVDYRPSGVDIGGYSAELNSRVIRPSVWVKTQSDGTLESSLPEQSQKVISNVEDCQLRLIDCHQFEDDGEPFTYLAFALLGPSDIGFHLESATSEVSEMEVSDAWLEINHMEGGWRMVISKELPGGITPENLSLRITDYSTSEEKNILLSDWGEPMSKEELETIGVYEIEGHLAVVSKGMPTIVSGTYGVGVGLGLIGPEFGNPDNSFPQLENPADIFHFYASDGTPLAQKVGKEMDCYMINNNIYAMFPLEEGADKNGEIKKLTELSPYMEYTNANGESFQFSLKLNE